jgi:glutamate decarboxylase
LGSVAVERYWVDRAQVSPLLRVRMGLSDCNVLIGSYPLPPSCEDTEILRVVIRESLSGDLARKLLSDIIEV